MIYNKSVTIIVYTILFLVIASLIVGLLGFIAGVIWEDVLGCEGFCVPVSIVAIPIFVVATIPFAIITGLRVANNKPWKDVVVACIVALVCLLVIIWFFQKYL